MQFSRHRSGNGRRQRLPLRQFNLLYGTLTKLWLYWAVSGRLFVWENQRRTPYGACAIIDGFLSMVMDRMKFATTLCVSMLSLGVSGANAAEIVPHAAKYTLSLQKLNIDGTPQRSGGTMDVRFSRDCYHWWIDRELKFDVEYADKRKTKLVISERFRETLSGKLFWFWSRTTLNGQTVSIIAGNGARPDQNEMVDVEAPKPEPKDKDSAAANASDAAGKKKAAKTPAVTRAANAAENKKPTEKAAKKGQRLLGVKIQYDWPETTEIELSQGVMFPVFALRQQLNALAAGALLREQTIFDGSRRNGATRALYSTINPPTGIVSAALPDGDIRLLDEKSWRFTTRYIPLDGPKSAKPYQVITRKLHANGIVSELLRDLGPFSIKGSLNWVKELPLPTCE